MSFQIHKRLLSASIDSVQNIAQYENLKKTDYRVLLFLMGHLDSLRYKKVDTKQIAEELRLSKSEVKESIKNLLLVGLLVEGESEHVKKGYKFIL